MKKLFIIFVLVITATGAGCTGKSYFEEKRDCSEYTNSFYEFTEVYDYTKFDSILDKDIRSNAVEHKICYSKTQETCIGMFEVKTKTPLDFKLFSSSFYVMDLITNQLLEQIDYPPWENTKDADDTMASYEQQKENIIKNLDCEYLNL